MPLDGQHTGSSPVTPTVVDRRPDRGRRGPEGVPQLADRGGEFLKLARGEWGPGPALGLLGEGVPSRGQPPPTNW